jgi:hypothetical protein
MLDSEQSVPENDPYEWKNNKQKNKKQQHKTMKLTNLKR